MEPVDLFPGLYWISAFTDQVISYIRTKEAYYKNSIQDYLSTDSCTTAGRWMRVVRYGRGISNSAWSVLVSNRVKGDGYNTRILVWEKYITSIITIKRGWCEKKTP